jgi:2-polyprenyl-3-methyl-5-hydroxy-6-metoxy-1,4-benzoquinol methylase
MRRAKHRTGSAPPSLTDRERSVEASEFVWDEESCSDTHDIVLPPIVAALHSWNARDVLDLGCGNGAATRAVAAQGFKTIGIDSSASGIQIAHSVDSEVQFEAHDIQLPLPSHLRNRFDAVVAIEVIEHLFKPRDLLRRASEALRPDGHLIVTTPYHGYLKNLSIALLNGFDSHVHPLRDYGHIKFFSPQTLAQLVAESDFTVLSIKRVGRIPPFAKSMVLSARKGRSSTGRF